MYIPHMSVIPSQTHPTPTNAESPWSPGCTNQPSNVLNSTGDPAMVRGGDDRRGLHGEDSHACRVFVLVVPLDQIGQIMEQIQCRGAHSAISGLRPGLGRAAPGDQASVISHEGQQAVVSSPQRCLLARQYDG